jgi:hypothetical protein
MPVHEAMSRQRTREKKPAPSMPRVSPRLKFLWGLILAGLTVLLFLWTYFSYYGMQEHCQGPWESQNVEVALYSTKYLSAGDVEEISATVINERSDVAPITVTVTYSGTLLCLAGDKEGSTISFGPVPAQGRATGRLKVQFPLCLSQLSSQNWPGQQVEFKIQMAVDNQPPQMLSIISLPIMPIPRARMLSNLSGVMLVGLVALSWKELMDWLKKVDQPTSETEAKAGAQTK